MLESIVGCLCGAGFIAAYFAAAAWAVSDARKRGQNGGVIILLFWLLGPLSALIWLAIRPSQHLIQVPPASFMNAEDTLSAASRLEQLGEWTAAAELYKLAAERWPEHRPYAEQCLAQIEHKQAIAR